MEFEAKTMSSTIFEKKKKIQTTTTTKFALLLQRSYEWHTSHISLQKSSSP